MEPSCVAPRGPVITAIAPAEALTDDDPAATDLYGHPRGLAVIFGTKVWDGISFFGMQALLTLYMAEQLLLPGHVEHVIGFARFRGAIEGVTGPLSAQALAAQIFGLFIGAAYFTPIIGGWIADRHLGLRNTITGGALLMAAGHLCMAFDASFLIALSLLIAGSGLMEGNIRSQVGALYSKTDRRRADGFQIYYLSVNLSAFIAPIITGLLAQNYGWHIGFGFAGVGMLIGLGVYLAGSRHLPPDPPRRARAPPTPLTAAERRRVLLLFAVMPLCALFWISQSQVWNVYNIWVRDHVDLVVAGWSMPVPWLQAVDGLSPAIMMPATLWLWRVQAARGGEPDEFGKLAIGCLIFAASMVWLAAASWLFAGKVPVLWAIGFHLLSNMGWLYFVPISMALFARAAPARINGMMMGVATLAIFLGSTISGRIGGFYEVMTPAAFWMLHAAITAAGALLFVAAAPALRRRLLAG